MKTIDFMIRVYDKLSFYPNFSSLYSINTGLEIVLVEYRKYVSRCPVIIWTTWESSE